VTILEAMRVMLTDSRIASGQALNTIEFHWYAAEEGGLLGSQAIFTNYKNSGKVVKAMLQQDMTGYVKPGTKEAVGVITDYVDAGLTSFIKRVVTAVSVSFVPLMTSDLTRPSIALSHTSTPSAATHAPTMQVHLRLATHLHSSSRARSPIQAATSTPHKIRSALSVTLTCLSMRK
jgi:Zn-dependent M28 family amino/carboxypeptidase